MRIIDLLAILDGIGIELVLRRVLVIVRNRLDRYWLGDRLSHTDICPIQDLGKYDNEGDQVEEHHYGMGNFVSYPLDAIKRSLHKRLLNGRFHESCPDTASTFAAIVPAPSNRNLSCAAKQPVPATP